MTRDAAVVIVLILLSASWALAHLVLLARVMRAPSLPLWARALSLVPVATPWFAVRAGMRTLPALWLVLGVAYLVTRSVWGG